MQTRGGRPEESFIAKEVAYPGCLRKTVEVAIQGRLGHRMRQALGKRWAGSFWRRLEGEVVRHGPEAGKDGATGGARRGVERGPERRSRAGGPLIREHQLAIRLQRTGLNNSLI